MKKYEQPVAGDVIEMLLHPRKLTTTLLKPKPSPDFGVIAGAKMALTYDSWEPRICVSGQKLRILTHEPPVSPCVTTIMGASSGASSS